MTLTPESLTVALLAHLPGSSLFISEACSNRCPQNPKWPSVLVLVSFSEALVCPQPLSLDMLFKRDSRSSWRGRYIIRHFSAASRQRTSRQNHRSERRGGMSSNSPTSPRPNILFGEQWITKIRHSAKLVGSLPPEMQRTARDAYAVSLKQVFIFASVATFFAYLVRLPVSLLQLFYSLF